jgi:hypothetical protein
MVVGHLSEEKGKGKKKKEEMEGKTWCKKNFYNPGDFFAQAYVGRVRDWLKKKRANNFCFHQTTSPGRGSNKDWIHFAPRWLIAN